VGFKGLLFGGGRPFFREEVTEFPFEEGGANIKLERVIFLNKAIYTRFHLTGNYSREGSINTQ